MSRQDRQAAPPPAWVKWGGSSYLPHTPIVIPVYLTPSVPAWDSDFSTHFSNAVGYWNLNLHTTAFEEMPTETPLTRTWIVRAGSDDESRTNATVSELGYAFEPTPTCGAKTTWATVYAAKVEWVGDDEHRRFQKICIRGNSFNDLPNATKGPNPQGYHYWWLMFVHELGHVLSLSDYQPGACVMDQGEAMKHPCVSELDFVNAHYGL